MGITIDYKFKAGPCDEAGARSLVYKLRQRALDLPFLEVGEIREFGPGEISPFRFPRKSPDTLLHLQAIATAERQEGDRCDEVFLLVPSRLFVFSAIPGPGAGIGFFGLGVYHDHIKDCGESADSHVENQAPPKLERWSWQGDCKTQFALSDKHGGMPNFLRTHMTLVKLLDFAKELGILAKVSDEGGYWDNRSFASLAAEAMVLNLFIGAFSGAAGCELVSKMLEHIAKEHPELGPFGPVKEVGIEDR